MKLLLKIIFIFMAIFLSIFLLIKFFNIFTIDDIKLWFEAIKSQPSYVVGALVMGLLFVDLFLSIPTMVTVLLAGYFLGFFMGMFYAFIGLAMASFTGYFLSLKYGSKVLSFVTNNQEQISEMQESFAKYGISMIVLSRAVPMLPEISSALAGVTKMPFQKFLIAWFFSSFPYVLILSYAGSVSEIDNPKPALMAVGGFTFLLWITWFVFRKRKV